MKMGRKILSVAVDSFPGKAKRRQFRLAALNSNRRVV
jgi:hypothetical protein